MLLSSHGIRRRNEYTETHTRLPAALKSACTSGSGGNRVGHVCRDSDCRELASPDCERLNEDWRSVFQFAHVTLVSSPPRRRRQTRLRGRSVAVTSRLRGCSRGCEKY